MVFQIWHPVECWLVMENQIWVAGGVQPNMVGGESDMHFVKSVRIRSFSGPNAKNRPEKFRMRTVFTQ